jgi:AcrB/AcrD/AcrF family protein
LNLPPGYSGRLNGQTRYLDETTTNLIMAMALASVFVYMVLAAQFESFVQPIIIMLVLPLSIPFALFTIWATGRTLNLWSALGILLLFGIVKKNSILQVDYTNVLRARGMPMREALVEACRARHRRRRRAALGDCRDDHRRAVALSLPDAAAGAGGLREVRRARAVDRQPALPRLDFADHPGRAAPSAWCRELEATEFAEGTD